MDKLSRQVFHYLKNAPKNALYYEDYRCNHAVDEDDLLSCCKYLCDIGLAEFMFYSCGIDFGIKLTHIGKNLSHFRLYAFFKFFATRFLCGVATGVVSTLLAEYLLLRSAKLFELISLLLRNLL